MKLQFQKIIYEHLNPKQKELFNFQKLSGLLADYGLETIRINNDWNGADFLMIDCNNENVTYKVQLKSRFTLNLKYTSDKNLYIAFPYKNNWYLFHHKSILENYSKVSNLENDKVWKETGKYSQANLSKKLEELLHEYLISENHDYQSCPICLNKTDYSTRYPNQICHDCVRKLNDENGNPIQFSNITILGQGVKGRYKDADREYNSHICYVNGTRCKAAEHHFGGIVVEVE